MIIIYLQVKANILKVANYQEVAKI